MIVLPMAGKSSRFGRAGYRLPKYQLPLGDKTVLHAVLLSFEAYFQDEAFVFITRRDHACDAFVREVAKACGLRHFQVVTLTHDTRGQADTVFQAAVRLGLRDQELLVFNIDTIRPGFKKPVLHKPSSGFLEVFSAPGEQWSYVEPGPENTVRRTTEKLRISDLCSTGLYQFQHAHLFTDAFSEAADDFARGRSELAEMYIAPLYNRLIAQGHSIHYVQVAQNEVTPCGVPAEYEALRKAWPTPSLRASNV